MIDTKNTEEIKEKLIAYISSHPDQSTEDLAEEFKLDHQVMIGLCKGLEMNEVIIMVKKEEKQIQLTADGKNTMEKGSPDMQLLRELKANGNQTKKALSDKLGKNIFDRGFGLAMKAKRIQYDKGTDTVSLKSDTLPSTDSQLNQLKLFMANPVPDKHDEKILKEYIKTHKLITIEISKLFIVKKGINFDFGLIKLETDLTSDLLVNDKWKTTKFKKYNYNSLGKEAQNGALHRLLSVRTQIREIFLETGFEEMPTNNWVEASFWNFDSLFQPQQHPSRDAHDTFFLKYPASAHTDKTDPEYFNKVKEVHEKGGYGSIGWQYKWSNEEALKNIFRTHTTAVSARMLYKLADDYKKTGIFTPKKYFSIDRVFRNESLDNTHLAEFHQIEGLIADYDLGLGHLIGTIETFFKRFGINKLKFKPAYNPYTEPSMEIFAYHDVSKKWVEIGNSGIFRPEMLGPMDLPSNVNVIAWGLSLERPTMIHYRLENIRELFGHEVNIKHTQDSSIYVFK